VKAARTQLADSFSAETKIKKRITRVAQARKYRLAGSLASMLEMADEPEAAGDLDLEATERVVVNSELGNIDKRALGQAIKKAHTASEIKDKYRPAPRLNKCLDDLQNLQKVARRLEVLLCRDNDATDFITSTKNGAELVYEFLNLRDRIDGCYDCLKEESRNRDRRVITTAEWLAGVELPCVYEEFSGCGLPEGYPVPPKMVAFVESAMRELGFRYSASSIGRAIRSLREKRRYCREPAPGKNTRQVDFLPKS
jgi:hypothetical protein